MVQRARGLLRQGLGVSKSRSGSKTNAMSIFSVINVHEDTLASTFFKLFKCNVTLILRCGRHLSSSGMHGIHPSSFSANSARLFGVQSSLLLTSFALKHITLIKQGTSLVITKLVLNREHGNMQGD